MDRPIDGDAAARFSAGGPASGAEEIWFRRLGRGAGTTDAGRDAVAAGTGRQIAKHSGCRRLGGSLLWRMPVSTEGVLSKSKAGWHPSYCAVGSGRPLSVAPGLSP